MTINQQRPIFFALISAMLLLCAFIVAAITFYVLVIAHWHGPFRDMWEIYPFLQKIISGTWTLKDLWESYGYSHRLFFPRLLFIADHQFFSATNHLLVGVSVICQILICYLFSVLLWRENQIAVTDKCALISILTCLQFSGTLLFNFMHTFDVQWFTCCFFVVFAFYQMSYLVSDKQLITDKSSMPYLAISGVLIGAASLSNFSGMAAWPIWILFVFARLQNLKFKFVLTIAAGVFIALYISDIRGAHVGHENMGELFKYIAYVFVAFPLLYLANPLSDTDFLPFGTAAAFIAIPALYILGKFWTEFLMGGRDSKINRLTLFLACIGLFGYGVAVITAIGRGYDPAHVRAMRYQNVVLLFWSAVIILAVLESRYYRRPSKYLLLLPFIAAFCGFISCQNLSWNQNMRLGYQVNRAHLALMIGYSKDVPMIAPTVSRSMIYVPGYNLERERALYEEARMGIYYGEMADSWLNGVTLSTISRNCQNLSWALSLYKGPYSEYTSFSVSGVTAGYDHAYLVNETGKVLAIAIPESASNLINSMQGYIRPSYSPVLKGFAISDQKPFAVVMSRGAHGSSSCLYFPASSPSIKADAGELSL